MIEPSVPVYEAELQRILKELRVIIEEDFGGCGLKERVIDRIKELVTEWKKQKLIAEREGREIGGLGVIFMDLLRAVEKAREDSKRYGKSFCEYLEKILEKPYYKEGGLGYWSLSMWGIGRSS